jgi:ABC-2 type transport system ATP-binding protein
MSTFLRATNLRRSFGDRVVLDGLSFSVEHGEVFGVLGPNGAGKSTLFNILCGMLEPHGGTLELDGAPFHPTDLRERRRLGVVFQEPSLDDLLTGRENLLCALSLYGLTGAAAKKRVDEVLDIVELTDRQHEAVGKYSGGMKRRLELGRVLLHRPKLLLMDEPGRGLDAGALRRYFTELLRLVRKEGLTVLLITHLPEEAQHCNRLAVIDEGRLVACDTREALEEKVGGDIVTVEADDAEALAAELAARLGPEARIVHRGESELTLMATRAHELLPRLVESLPRGRLRAISMRRPSLGDVFLHLTGRGLENPQEASATAPKGKNSPSPPIH